MGQDPVVDIQHAAFALVLVGKVDVVADVDVDTVVVDRIHDFPVVRLLPGRNVVVRFLQTAVGEGNQVLRHGHTDLHSAIRFISAVILVGPPDAGADAFAGRDDK